VSLISEQHGVLQRNTPCHWSCVSFFVA